MHLSIQVHISMISRKCAQKSWLLFTKEEASSFFNVVNKKDNNSHKEDMYVCPLNRDIYIYIYIKSE